MKKLIVIVWIIGILISCSYPLPEPEHRNNYQRVEAPVVYEKRIKSCEIVSLGDELVNRIVYDARKIEPEETEWQEYYENISVEQARHYIVGKTYIENKRVIGW